MGSSPPSFPVLQESDILRPGSSQNSNGSNFHNADDNSNSIDGVFPSPSTHTFDPEASNSSSATHSQWPRPVENQRPSPFLSNENSVFRTALSVEESDSTSLPGVQIRERSSPVKRPNESADEPPQKVRRVIQSDDEDDSQTCPICLDPWSNSGEHRMVALKCGHVFGARCVERWLKARPQRERRCPTCKAKACVRDMRHIYANRLVAVDNSDTNAMQNAMQKQVEQLQTEKVKVELELQKTKMAHQACAVRLETLMNTIKTQLKPQTQRPWRFALENNLQISKDGGCRVLTYNCRTCELYVSQKSTNNLLPGYGIKKVSCVDFKQGRFVHLHPKPIRDISYSQPNDLLLSVSLDSSARIVERGIPITTIPAGVQLWSCSWDYMRTNEFYVGGVGGFIQQYDMRNPSTYIQRVSAPGDMSPVVSLCSTEFGLLSCHLNSCWLWGPLNSGQWEPRCLPVESPAFMSLCYDNDSQRALVSCRPGSNGERSRLALCQFSDTNRQVTCRVQGTFHGSTRSSLMSRASWVRAPGASWVAVHSESDATLFLHGLDGARTIWLPAAEPALDICSVQQNGETILAALSEARLRIYTAVPTRGE